jgi:hypothetical protein
MDENEKLKSSPCLKCRYFGGVDVDYIVRCIRKGKSKLMLICPYFDPGGEKK